MRSCSVSGHSGHTTKSWARGRHALDLPVRWVDPSRAPNNVHREFPKLRAHSLKPWLNSAGRLRTVQPNGRFPVSRKALRAQHVPRLWLGAMPPVSRCSLKTLSCWSTCEPPAADWPALPVSDSHGSCTLMHSSLLIVEATAFHHQTTADARAALWITNLAQSYSKFRVRDCDHAIPASGTHPRQCRPCRRGRDSPPG